MRFAAVETSGEWCSVALWADGEISALERRAGVKHAELVLPMLERLLAARRMSARELDAVAFGAGPGSFTGLRIACGVAQGLAFARGIPLLGVPTLEALAEESGAGRVLACLDARMHEVYYAALERGPSGWCAAIETQCVAPAAAPLPAGGGWHGCGNGFAAYREALAARLGDALGRVSPETHASAVAVARLAAPRLAAGEGVDAALAAPLYVRDKVALTTQERGGR
ncbi:MAG TPA: tRNA (adenosine(37)-N6)-threonylcarbamoyltransferase complex dimerization subunit type 1 TsaB [Burkholderiales bacterium]|nr:tRNA (adenosine(37)-N6)-threonylcarbamoyltransferase complex dimerization subunit type 1 TsaB [Burkholderiales bacterium]